MQLKCLLGICFILCFSANAEKHALLVGVSDYQSKFVTDLEGPYYDVKSFEKLLPSWGVEKKNIRSLINRSATKANILAEISRLKVRTKPGDEVFIYLSGHGTSASDKKTNLPLAHTTGAFLPYDSNVSNPDRALASLIIGSRDLKPLLKELDKDRQIFIVVDACYSENTARSIFAKEKPTARAESLNFDVFANVPVQSKSEEASSEYPYQNIVFMAASSKSEVAGDYPQSMSHLTYDGNPHGVFSDALLRVMSGMLPADSNRDKKLSYLELYKATSEYLSDEAQSPKLSYQKSEGAIDLGVLSTNNPELVERISASQGAQSARLNLYVAPALEHLESVFFDVDFLELVKQSDRANIQLVEKGQAVVALGASGEVIRTFTRMNNRMLMNYLKAQHWLKSMKSITEAGGFNVAVEFSGKGQGSTVTMGEKFGIDVITDKQSNLWLFTMDSKGKVSTLFPYNNREYRLYEKGRTRPFPELMGKMPLGEDWVIAVALKNKNKLMEKFIGAEFSASSEKAALLHSTLYKLRQGLAKHEQRLFTVR